MAKGADVNALDNEGKTALDRLNEGYEEVQKLISQMTCQNDFSFGRVSGENSSENRSDFATLPTREERENNITLIREILEHGPRSLYITKI
jgi:hypothetical protein